MAVVSSGGQFGAIAKATAICVNGPGRNRLILTGLQICNLHDRMLLFWPRIQTLTQSVARLILRDGFEAQTE